MGHGKVGFCCGAFDLLHAGHVSMLRDAKSVCDWLVVGLQVDPSADRPRKHAPVQRLHERMVQLQAVRYVDEVVCYESEADLLELLKLLRPDVRVLGSDWRNRTYTGMGMGVPVYWHERAHSYSTSGLRQRVVQAETELEEEEWEVANEVLSRVYANSAKGGPDEQDPHR